MTHNVKTVDVKYGGDLHLWMKKAVDLLDEGELEERKDTEVTQEHAKYLVDYFAEILADYSIDLTKYTHVTIMVFKAHVIDVIRFESEKADICISKIWFDRETCKVNQYGSNYGRLTL